MTGSSSQALATQLLGLELGLALTNVLLIECMCLSCLVTDLS